MVDKVGLFSRLFHKKEQQDMPEADWEQIVYERDQLNVHDDIARLEYLTNCMEQIGEAQKEIMLLTGEYSLVTSYLTDMEEIEALPIEELEHLKEMAGRITSFEQERLRYQDKKKRMTEDEFHRMKAQEEEIESGIGKLRECESYQKVVRQDLKRLDGERHAYSYRRIELQSTMANLRGMLTICITAFTICILMLLVLQFGFKMETAIGYYVAVAAMAVAVTAIGVKYMDADRELSKVENANNRLIHLQNTVKIRYVNNTQLLDYLYMKYGVKEASYLQELWNMYQDEKEERRQYAEAEAGISYYQQLVVRFLMKFHIKFPERWTNQAKAIVDPREMIELRHSLIGRRQALRKQLDYNKGLADSAKAEVKDIAAKYPQYAPEITRLVEQYERNFE